MNKMRQLKRGNNEFPYGNLESNVLAACFLASKYSPKKDQLDSRRRIGGLQLSTSLAKGSRKPQNVGRNSLVLHLTAFLKFYTSDESSFEWVGQKLPDFGQEDPELVAGFVNAVYMDEKIVAKGVERITLKSQKDGTRLAHWKLQS